jgi:hypothetical protein
MLPFLFSSFLPMVEALVVKYFFLVLSWEAHCVRSNLWEFARCMRYPEVLRADSQGI